MRRAEGIVDWQLLGAIGTCCRVAARYAVKLRRTYRIDIVAWIEEHPDDAIPAQVRCDETPDPGQIVIRSIMTITPCHHCHPPEGRVIRTAPHTGLIIVPPPRGPLRGLDTVPVDRRLAFHPTRGSRIIPGGS